MTLQCSRSADTRNGGAQAGGPNARGADAAANAEPRGSQARRESGTNPRISAHASRLHYPN